MHSHTSVRDSLVGLGLALFSILNIELMSESLAFSFVALMLPTIAAIYLGFALASNGKMNVFTQIGAVVLYTGLAMYALEHRSWLTNAIGIGIHALWDLLFHKHESVPHFYVPFCAVFDISFSSWLIYRYVL
ncbi:predicted protein [Naegleria gruberi]|uniref:Predicted protein n=1 Tax=Naegleria gruberi TaxID=5762 RepID=D2V5P9_NAEGR|nr:uncharacterized protein NAEGRDRAFT_64159 [Naegleria gruberi]EFC47835.1 predicted protein [Naegleria gruberi]|eukprot:XP_002680579.1 predicted protein [Naegleria gruberi strain NEG-M]